MKYFSLPLAFMSLPLFGIGQNLKPSPSEWVAPASNVSISAKGLDVRTVLASVFEQAHEQYVFDSPTRTPLYLSLNAVSFAKALKIVCGVANLEATVSDGVYFIHSAPKPGSGGVPEAGAVDTPAIKNEASKTPAIKTILKKNLAMRQSAPKAPLTTAKKLVLITPPKAANAVAPLPTSLLRHVKIHVQKADLRVVFAEIARQAQIPITVDPEVPAYKLDVNLHYCRLTTALTRVTSAAGLVWKVQPNHSVLISVAEETPTIQVLKD